MLKFKKLSWRITAIVCLAVIIVGGMLAVYSQTRIMFRIEQYSVVSLKNEVNYMTAECNLAFIDAIYKTKSVRNFVEANFDVSEYARDPENYLENVTRPVMNGFLYNTISRSYYISAAYFAIHPMMLGEIFEFEIYFYEEDGIINEGEAVPHEDFEDPDCEDMEWFFGAYLSGMPHWTHVYEDAINGVIMVSYAEPVIIGGRTIGIVGVDIPINHINDLIKDVQIYNTGFALMEDVHDEFFNTNDFIRNLSGSEQQALRGAAANADTVFEIKLGGTDFVVVTDYLVNDYKIYALAPAKEFRAEAMSSIRTWLILFPFVMIGVFLVSSIVGKRISKPIVKVEQSVGALADGIFDTTSLESYMQRPDEIGILARGVRKLHTRLEGLTGEIKVLADKDLTGDVKLAFDGDAIGIALKSTLENLNHMFAEINVGMKGVSGGSRQVADSSQSLAQGAEEQSAVIEEFSATIDGIKDKTRQSADIARQASELTSAIRSNAEKGDEHMNHMMQAIEEINDASGQIEKVIKVIDDIAFQTNILALNAAVEAARAGTAGKGFAVVAEEVRNLAGKSAEAAKNTGGLITNTVEKARLGRGIAAETAASLKEIVEGINNSTEIVSRIAQYCDEQAIEIGMLNTSINQVADVAHQNSAASEQIAAASEEMSAHAEAVEKLIAQFKLKR